MKKFLSLLLAAMMLLSCATAMATSPESDKVDSVINESIHAWLDNTNVSDKDKSEDADIDVRVENARYGDAAKFDTKGEAATEIWLQVDATGQIDVTVPLVLVFQTNIDGGHAISPDAYKFTNNSTADLVVTNIKTTLVKTDDAKQPMTMMEYGDGNTITDKEDHYAARITGIKGTMGKGMTAPFDLFTSATKPHHNDAVKGGLFELAQKSTNTTGVTELQVEMKTSPLSFVTSRDYTEGSDTSSMTDTKGVQLLTITYTVAIDTSDAIGEKITDTAKEKTAPFTGTTDAEKIVEKTDSGASEEGDRD